MSTKQTIPTTAEIMSWNYEGVKLSDRATTGSLFKDPHVRHVYEAMTHVASQQEGFSGVAHGIACALSGTPNPARPDGALDGDQEVAVGYIVGVQLIWSVLRGFERGQRVAATPPGLTEEGYLEGLDAWISHDPEGEA